MTVSFFIRSENKDACIKTLDSIYSLYDSSFLMKAENSRNASSVMPKSQAVPNAVRDSAPGNVIEGSPDIFILDCAWQEELKINDDTLSAYHKEGIGLCVSRCIRDQETGPFFKLLPDAKGEYICLTEAGCIYSGDLSASLSNSTGLEKSGIIALRGKRNNSKSTDRFSRFFTSVTAKVSYINTTYTPAISLAAHSAYFVRKDIVLEAVQSQNIPDSRPFFWAACGILFHAATETPFIGVLNRHLCDFSAQINAEERYFTSYNELQPFVCDFFFPMVAQISSGWSDIPDWFGYQILDVFSDWIRFGEKADFQPENDTYKAIALALLIYVNDYILKEDSRFDASRTAFWLEKKHNRPVTAETGYENIFYSCKNMPIGTEAGRAVSIRFLRIHDGVLEIEGVLTSVHGKTKPMVYLLIEDRKYVCDILNYDVDTFWSGEILRTGCAFCGSIPLADFADINNISIGCTIDGSFVRKWKITYGKFAPISEKIKNSWYEKDGWILSHGNNGVLVVERATAKLRRIHKKALNRELQKKGRKAATKNRIFRSALGFLRFFYGRNKIWLVSDRINRGNDNGEAFFEYISMHPELMKGRKAYFVIEKNCPDAKRIRKYGKLVEPMSWKHKILHLLSEYIISSQGNDPVVNPFKSLRIYYQDLLQEEKFVFLQHGVIKDNLSGWLNKYNRNIYGFIVSTVPEYNSILEYNYGYTAENVWLTGLPRFDRLYHEEKKYITIMPTWRKSLTKGTDPVTSVWLLQDDFDDSDYRNFYNSLLNHEELISFAKAHGYTLAFMPHPVIIPYIKEHFTRHPDVIFWDENKAYREVFAQTNLLITDYSSVAYDFAYLRKPIMYCHFDYQEFYNGSHSYTEGYFDYERDGFGEVVFDLESAVAMIKEYIENDCAIKEKYLLRINNTFAHCDKNNCQRVFEHIK